MRPAPGLPDLVFTANAAVVLDGKALLAHFRHPERQREEPHFAKAFEAIRAQGVFETIRTSPEGLVLEGAGDCVWDEARNLFWMGYGQRSDAAAAGMVEETFGVDAVALELADPRFYHIDTALRPLPRGEVMYFPAAFTREGRAILNERVASPQRIEIGTTDARRLAANGVGVGDTLIVPACSARLRARLEERGYHVLATPLGAFRRSGGAAFCLTLRLDQRSAARAEAGVRAGAAEGELATFPS
jgi:N-dimethylarginine dimethylaminohydrolase